MNEKILLKSQSNKIIKITRKKVIQCHQYYTTVVVELEDQKNTKIMYKLLSSANPFISLYQLYLLYAPPTPVKDTRQFISFVIKCWKKYLSFNLNRQQNFIADFFGNFYVKIHAFESDEAINAVRNVLCLSPQQLNSEKQVQAYLYQFKTAETILKMAIVRDLASLKKGTNEYEQLSLKLKIIPKMLRESTSNLENISITFLKQKIQLLEKICKSLPKQWQVQLFFDQSKDAAYILTKNMLQYNQEIIPFQDFLHPLYEHQSNLKQMQVENLAFEIIDKLFTYNDKYDYKLSMDPSNFVVILNKHQNSYSLSKHKCQINYISPILQHIGLDKLTSTAENKLVFQSRYQPLHRKLNFTKQLQKFISPDKIIDTNNAIKWMIYFDHIFCRLFVKGKTSMLETQSIVEGKWEDYLLNKLSNHQYEQKETYLFHSWTICVLDSLLSDYAPRKTSGSTDKKEQILSIITLDNLRSIFSEQSKKTLDQRETYNPNRVDLIIKILQFQGNLYFSQEGIKYFFLKNNNLNQLSSQQRYLCIYFLAKLAQLNVLLILNLFKIQHQKDRQQIKEYYNKFDIVIQKLAKKLEIQSNQLDQNTEKQRQLFMQLQQINLNKQNHMKIQDKQNQLQQLIRKIRQQLSNLLKKPRELIEAKFKNLKQRKENKSTSKSSLLYAKTCIIFVSIFQQLNIKNIVDFIFIQKQLREIKRKQKLLTSQQIYDQINDIQKKIQSMKQKGQSYKKVQQFAK